MWGESAIDDDTKKNVSIINLIVHCCYFNFNDSRASFLNVKSIFDAFSLSIAYARVYSFELGG